MIGRIFKSITCAADQGLTLYGECGFKKDHCMLEISYPKIIVIWVTTVLSSRQVPGAFWYFGYIIKLDCAKYMYHIFYTKHLSDYSVLYSILMIFLKYKKKIQLKLDVGISETSYKDFRNLQGRRGGYGPITCCIT